MAQIDAEVRALSAELEAVRDAPAAGELAQRRLALLNARPVVRHASKCASDTVLRYGVRWNDGNWRNDLEDDVK